ncbi:gas vesicle protein [Streptomyces sp. NPDC088354]|uniref:gas vesicle protein n=1 Tax=Streptomyces sp. NPDC088354 TaxID=3365856 RepID=UPI00381A48DC
MTDPADKLSSYPTRGQSPYSPYGQGGGSSANLADILERVLDKGIVIAGDIKINLLDIELLTIKLRLIVASVDKAREMGIDWWEHDPSLSSRAGGESALAEENKRLRAEVEALREQRELPAAPERKPAARPRRTAARPSSDRPSSARRRRETDDE